MKRRGFKNKIVSRGLSVFSGSMYSMITPGLGLIFYMFFVREYTLENWGSLVTLILMVNLFQQLAGWGNKSYLLREFSLKSNEISRLWNGSFLSRLPILLIPFSGYFVIFEPHLAIGLCLWQLILFIYQSFEVYNIYYRNFLSGIIAEISSFLLLILCLFFFPDFEEPVIFVQCMAGAVMVKSLIVIISLRKNIPSLNVKTGQTGYLKLALPFFLMTVIGLFQEKTDLYLMAILGKKADLGKYHIIITAFTLLKTGAYFLIQPFLKNVFRLSKSKVRKLSFRLFFIGLLIIIPGTGGIYFIIPQIINTDPGLWIFIMGAVFSLPFYYYLIIIIRFQKLGKEKLILLISLCGILINATGSIILIPEFGLIGALISTVISEWVVAGIYYLKK